MKIIDLSKPIRIERVRGFQPPWYTVFIYHCSACKQEIRIKANSFFNKHPVPGIGGITCTHCKKGG